MRVLLVEDDSDTAALLSLVLESEGCTVRVADNALSALREFKRFQPTVVLVDIGLPLINGYDLAKRLQRRGNCGLIAVSSRPPPADGSHTNYFERYLMKPVDIASLREALTVVGTKYS